MKKFLSLAIAVLLALATHAHEGMWLLTKLKQINEAEGQASAILAVARATSEGLTMVSNALSSPGGELAARMRVAEEYLKQFGQLAQKNNTMIIPSNTADIAGMVATAMGLYEHSRKPQEVAAAAPPPKK
jgi:hypothetical protein